MPSSASVDLPLVHISAEYIQDPASANITNNKLESFTDGVVLCQGSYLSAIAEIGSFEHSLTTDLLNHLVLVQKVFMKVIFLRYNYGKKEKKNFFFSKLRII